jgi:integrase
VENQPFVYAANHKKISAGAGRVAPDFVQGDMLPALQAISDYLAWFSSGAPAGGTIRLRASHITTLLKTHPDILAVTQDDLIAYLGAHKWAPQTRKSHRSSLRSFYGWAYRNKLIDSDPAAELRAIRPPISRPRPTPEGHVKRAMMLATDTELVLVLLAGYAGLRRSEIANLRQDDVIGDQMHITGKGGRQRRIPIHPLLVDPLGRQMRRHKDSAWVFPSRLQPWCDRPVSGDWVSKTLKRLLGGELTAHTLRHRFATKAYQGSKDIRAVQELLGHSSPATTAVYTLIEDDALAAAVSMIA